MKRPVIISFLILGALAACSGERTWEDSYETAEEVLSAMKDRYEDTWYDTMTFVQTTVQVQAGGRADTTTWFEGMSLPGKLRIDIGDPASGNTWIFRNDSIYVFAQGALSVGRPTFHPLLLLGFDAYFLDSAELTGKLDSLGFDLDIMSDTTWQGRDVYVIGADAGDTSSQQFWIDKERLVFVRLLQNVGANLASQQDVQFNKYERLGQGWVAPEVHFYVDGELQMTETYHSMKEGVVFDERFFSPTSWQDADHWVDR